MTDYQEALENGFYTKDGTGITIMVKKVNDGVGVHCLSNSEWRLYDFITDSEAVFAFENRIQD